MEYCIRFILVLMEVSLKLKQAAVYLVTYKRNPCSNGSNFAHVLVFVSGGKRIGLYICIGIAEMFLIFVLMEVWLKIST